MTLRGVGPKSEAESMRFHGRRVTKVDPEVKQLPPEDWGPLNKGCEVESPRGQAYKIHLYSCYRFVVDLARWRGDRD